ncbi:uncharacterized protein ACR2FA_009811 [Aphomia sociella]
MLTTVDAGPSTDTYKDQYCTDPRTMKKHAAYTEWADAYSCTRHRCQPGGRNLAIYTVGCKRVEAPNSAIECEEVVEDTNMQFPFCCTRLRCLVVVRGEVWTRVLGQPWETLPAAPWSHMYKMKKPPPSNGGPFLPKSPSEGPVYELATDQEDLTQDKILRAIKKGSTDAPDCNDVAPRAVPAPDIVIALSTNNEQKEQLKEFKKTENVREMRHKRTHKQPSPSAYFDVDMGEAHNEPENEELVTEKSQVNNQRHQVAWTEIPQNQWNENDPASDAENAPKIGVSQENVYHQPEYPPIEPEKKEEKPTNLQALVDAIGNRMRDIENVVHRMSEKVHQVKPGEMAEVSGEKRTLSDADVSQSHKNHKSEEKEYVKDFKAKRPRPDAEHYKRFSVRNRSSKYLHSTSSTTEQPLFVEDMNGYFSDASNSVLRRAAKPPKDPVAIYMAPVESRRKSHAVSDSSNEVEKKHKKHSHKKKRGKSKNHKKHHKDDKRKRLNRLNSVELGRDVVSLEDSSANK